MYMILYTFFWMKLIIFSAILMPSLTHPVSMLINIIFLTSFISFLLTNSLKMNWLTLIFLLMILGGMLILFSYMTSLTSNQMFKPPKFFFITILVFFFINLPLSFKNNYLMTFKCNIYQLYKSVASLNTIISMLYLLLVLLIIVELICNFKNPLRSQIYVNTKN